MEMPQEELSNLRIQRLKGSQEALEIMGSDDSAREVERGIDAVAAVRQSIAKLRQASERYEKTSGEFLRTQR